MINNNTNSWNPINKHFYDDDTSEDESRNILVKTPTNKDINIIMHGEAQLEWDSSPEHLELGHTPEDHVLEKVLQPHRLFHANDSSANSSLTQESSNDEVFFDDATGRKQKHTLTRKNAVRRQRNMASDPRITRDMLRSNRYTSTSCPTTPSEVILNRPQNLNNVIQRRRPIIPETVRMESAGVQRFDRVLELINQRNDETPAVEPPRTRRGRRVDYLHLHKYGTRS